MLLCFICAESGRVASKASNSSPICVCAARQRSGSRNAHPKSCGGRDPRYEPPGIKLRRSGWREGELKNHDIGGPCYGRR